MAMVEWTKTGNTCHFSKECTIRLKHCIKSVLHQLKVTLKHFLLHHSPFFSFSLFLSLLSQSIRLCVWVNCTQCVCNYICVFMIVHDYKYVWILKWRRQRWKQWPMEFVFILVSTHISSCINCSQREPNTHDISRDPLKQCSSSTVTM